MSSMPLQRRVPLPYKMQTYLELIPLLMRKKEKQRVILYWYHTLMKEDNTTKIDVMDILESYTILLLTWRTKSLFQSNGIILNAEITISDKDLTTSGKENVDVLYDVTKPANKVHFKIMVTKIIVNGLVKNATVKRRGSSR